MPGNFSSLQNPKRRIEAKVICPLAARARNHTTAESPGCIASASAMGMNCGAQKSPKASSHSSVVRPDQKHSTASFIATA